MTVLDPAVTREAAHTKRRMALSHQRRARRLRLILAPPEARWPEWLTGEPYPWRSHRTMAEVLNAEGGS